MAQAHRSFWTEPRGGVWAPVLARDTTFAEAYLAQDVDRYVAICEVSTRMLFDHHTAPRAEPEDLQAMDMPAPIIPGEYPAHAMSAVHCLCECLPRADFWPVGPADQEPQRVSERLMAFWDAHREQGPASDAPILDRETAALRYRHAGLEAVDRQAEAGHTRKPSGGAQGPLMLTRSNTLTV